MRPAIFAVLIGLNATLAAQTVTEQTAPAVETTPTETTTKAKVDEGGGEQAMAMGGGAEGAAGGGGAAGSPTAPGTLNFQADLFTGRFNYSIPIVVPPARQGAEPKLGLGYNSAGGNSWCGVGWGLEVGFIQRDTRKGVPVKWTNGVAMPLTEYDDDKGFVASIGGVSANLVKIAGGTPAEYRAEVDGAFLKFLFYDNYWRVVDKSGNTFLFGQTNTTRMENPKSGWTANAAKSTFRWALDRVVDVNGNETQITYTSDGNLLYLSQIRYNGNTNSPALTNWNTVDFTLTSRADTNITYQGGFRIETRKLLSDITVKAGGYQARRYALTYTNSAGTLRSLLASVRMYGADDSTTLPATTFVYQNKPLSFGAGQDWTGVSNLGLPWWVYSTIACLDSWQLSYVGTVDIDGDGLPDHLIVDPYATLDHFQAQRNTGSSFAAPWSWTNVLGGGSDTLWNYITYGSYYQDFLDMNGDGKPDRVMARQSSPYTNFNYQLNTGLNFANLTGLGPLSSQSQTSQLWNSPGARAVDSQNNSQYVGLYDMNGDGLPDRVMRKVSSPYTNFVVQFNLNGSLGEARTWPNVQGYDIYPDDYRLNSMDAAADGGGWVTLRDINGDGLPDRIITDYTNNYASFKVQFNNGAGFEAQEIWGPVDTQSNPNWGWGGASSTGGGATYVELFDINGDGLPDRVMRKLNSTYDRFKVQLNTGTGFGSVIDWTTLEGAGSDHGLGSVAYISAAGYIVKHMDMNGDGLVDRVMMNQSGQLDRWTVQTNRGPFPDLMAEVHNGIGGSVAVTYLPSTQYDNRDKDWTTNAWAEGAKALLPFPVYAVATVAVRDGMGATNTTTYSYRGGMFDGEKREFRGFNRVTVTDPLGAVQKTYFHQGGGRDETASGEYQDAGSKAKKGIPYLVEIYGSDGLLYSRTVNKVEETQLHTNGWYFPYISQSIQMEYEGQSGYRATAKQLTYDTATGNLTKESSFGEVSSVVFTNHTFTDVATNDNVFTHIAFATLSNGDIKNKPSSIKITSDSAGSNKLRETVFTYDGTRGNLLTKGEWLNTITNYLTGSIGYDTYGNPTTATNAGGIVTTTTYDANKTFALQQVTATFTNSATFDIRSGTVISATDVRGMTVSNVFDVFFRTTEVLVSTNAGGAPVLWKSRTDYALGGVTNGLSYNYVRSRVNDLTDSNGHESYTYADGLGRTRQTRTEAETSAGANQYRVVSPYYNQRGQVGFQTLPYFGTGSNYVVLTNTTLGAYTGFDALGRVSNTLAAVSAQFDTAGTLTSLTATGGDTGSPVGQALVFYREGTDPWATIAVDAEGKTNITRLDAYGRPTYHLQVGGTVTNYVVKEYNLVGDLTRVSTIGHEAGTWGSWIITTLGYDSLGRKTTTIDPSMGWWWYYYDSLGRMTNQLDAKGQSIRLFYNDALGRLTHKHVLNAGGTVVATSTNYYDSSGDTNYTVFKGQLDATEDSEGWTMFSYDARGRVVKSTRYLSVNSTSYTTETTYDDADRVTEVKYPGTSAARVGYEYDTAGNVARVFHRNGSLTNEYFYVAGTFNALGQALTFATASSNLWTTNTYYANSKRMSATLTASGGVTRQSLSYTFDNVSNLKGIWDSGYAGTASATMTNLVYDDFHRLTGLTSPQWGAKSYAYNAYGNMVTNSEAGSGQYAYTNSGKPYQATSANGKNYAYDANGNMTTRGSQTLAYDAENRLVAVTNGATVTTFGYAEGGSRLWRNGTNGLTIWMGGIYEVRGDGKVLCHVNVGGKRIATFEPAQLVTSLPTKYPWVAAQVKGFDRALAWPFQHGRTPVTVMVLTLLGILLASLAARGGLGLLGRARDGLVDLLARPSFKHTPQWWQELLLSLAELLPSPLGGERARERGSSSPSPISHLRSPKLWQQALSTWLIVALILGTTPTDVQAQTYTPVFYYYLDDHLGSSSVLTDRSGVVVQRYTYSAYGRTQHQNNTSAYPLERMFTGQLLDDETGLYFYNARYYDPELGRFIQPDTVVQDNSDGLCLNRYSYCGNNPTTFTDPSGNIFGIDDAIIWGVVIGAAIGGATAAATGGNIGMGILTGAISGVFGGIGSSLSNGALWGAVMGGATGGAVGAAITGGDVGMGALAGAIAGGISFGINGMTDGWFADKFWSHVAGFGESALAGALGGGFGSMIHGGSFMDGAAGGAIGGVIAYAIAVDLPDAIADRHSDQPHFALMLVVDVAQGVYHLGAGIYGAVGGSNDTAQFDVARDHFIDALTFKIGKAGRGVKAMASAGDVKTVANVAKTGGTAALEKAKSLAKGIPESQLGPSGKPKIHTVEKSTLKQRTDAARQDGSSKPIKHNQDKGQAPHLHPVDRSGNKLTGHRNVHYQLKGAKINPE